MKKLDIACVIEDNPANIFWMKEMMVEADFCNEIIVFYNGKEALDQLSSDIKHGKKLPDIIFLDVNMPVMDGWEFLDAFTVIPCSQKPLIYILTSSVDPSDLFKAQQYSIVTNYIVKPVTVEKLKEILSLVKI